ncbi:hypothetical protein AKJ51_04915 [candidate division MSBL1 archaeon SCGC-AAA382A20]|uniref:Uncharacterized protein n=1 Tax=candidate division MSBL1 archaeon SCGC-AAA382A20 TaxID=1698280 RepID=A0A133VGP8_9EURY|nr:hypothetical protein AKJ51_04915 [candidate division MSBL1 archaeon SCGC-AAA382A20]
MPELRKATDAEWELELVSYIQNDMVDPHGIRLFKNGNYALVPDKNGGAIFCLDVSDPENMKILSTVVAEETKGAHYVTIGIDEHFAYTGARGHFTVLDISDPENLSIYGDVEVVPAGESVVTQEIVLEQKRDRAYMAETGTCQIFAVDISDKINPTVICSVKGAGYPNFLESVAHLELDEDREVLFSTSYRDHHVGSFDVSPTGKISLFDTEGEKMGTPHELILNGNFLYIACMYATDDGPPYDDPNDGSLVVYEVSNPSDMKYVTEVRMGTNFPANKYPFDHIHGLRLDPKTGLLYASSQKSHGRKPIDNNCALTVFDIQNPAAPKWILSLHDKEVLNGAQQVDFYGDYLFTANHDHPNVACFRLRRI